MHRVDKRSEFAAILGLLLQLLLFGLFLILFKSNNSPATLAESWHLLAGVGIWILIFVELYQKRLATQQRNEVEDLERQRLGRVGGSQSVFQAVNPDEELPMEHRLKILKRWFVPIISLITAGLLVFFAARVTSGWWPMTWFSDAMESSLRNQLGSLSIIVGAALACFLVSRYCLGLSKAPGWRILRAGANYTMGNALVCAALAIVLALSNYGADVPERILAKIIPLVMVILAVEIILNLILDIYRPRMPEQERRPSYESRLLGLFCEPEGVMRSIAQTIDYQFGFKVSETWFYKLLQEAIIPLVLFALVTLYLFSIVVIVRPGQQVVVLRFSQKPKYVVKEGLHAKWPWPIDVAQIYPIKEIKQLQIGFTGESNWFNEENKNKPILWTVKHVTGDELQLLVASKNLKRGLRRSVKASKTVQDHQAEGKSNRSLSPVSILAGALIIHYNIKDDGLLDYISNYQNPDVILESLAYRQWTKYMASVDPMGVMTNRREKLTARLEKAIQSELDKDRSGIKLIKVAIVGIHPPVEIANAFEAAINARQERETLI